MEFAIVLPLLVLFVFGIIQFGLAFFRAQGMEAAVREGGRVAAIGLDGEDIYAAVRNGVGLVPIAPDHVEVCITDVEAGDELCGTTSSDLSGYTGCASETVRVAARVTNPDAYGLMIPFGPMTSLDFASEAHFRCEVFDG